MADTREPNDAPELDLAMSERQAVLILAHGGSFDEVVARAMLKGMAEGCVAFAARVRELEAELAGYRRAEADINDALNSGDGVYRP